MRDAAIQTVTTDCIQTSDPGRETTLQLTVVCPHPPILGPCHPRICVPGFTPSLTLRIVTETHTNKSTCSAEDMRRVIYTRERM